MSWLQLTWPTFLGILGWTIITATGAVTAQMVAKTPPVQLPAFLAVGLIALAGAGALHVLTLWGVIGSIVPG